MPRLPKDPTTRVRRNRSTTAATLVPNPGGPVPDLPEHDWHELTLAWWSDIWTSPMAPEFDASDKHGLFMLARLVDSFWRAETPTQQMKLAAEVRQQGQRFGLSPIDRRRLQWEISRAREAEKRNVPPKPRRFDAGSDPRNILNQSFPGSAS